MGSTAGSTIHTRRLLAALALVLALLAAACSASDSSDDGATDDSGSDTAEGSDDLVDAAVTEDSASAPEDEAMDDSGTANGLDGAAAPAIQAPSAGTVTGDAAAEAPFLAAPPATRPITPTAPPIRPEEPPVPDGRVDTNPFVATSRDPLSTFALDVDTGSYTFARNTLRNGGIPAPDSVRTEEFVNAIAQDYTQPADGVFEVHADGAAWPFAQVPGNQLLRVGLSTPEVVGERQQASLTFVVDVSGSMDQPGRLDLVREALRLLVVNLEPGDTMSIVAYDDSARVVMQETPWDAQADLLNGIARLVPGGSTNLSAGLDLGYALARDHLRPDGINRVILLSDGIANTGDTEASAILERVAVDAAQGIEMVAIGVGLGDFNDALMEELADDGDGFYAYVDSLEEAQRVFSTDLVKTLQTVAREARIQVEFNPATVSAYRLLGFENRAIADEEFRNDFRDAGELGAGHQVTALYEVDLTGQTGALAQVRLRWLDPQTGLADELARNIDTTAVDGGFAAANPVLQLDGLVAAWAEVMRGSGYAVATAQTLTDEARRIDALLGTQQSAEVAELIGLYTRFR